MGKANIFWSGTDNGWVVRGKAGRQLAKIDDAGLKLQSGSVIDFNNADITLTHSANKLTFAGGALELNDAATFILPTKASGSTNNGEFWVDTTDGNPHFYYEAQEYYMSKISV